MAKAAHELLLIALRIRLNLPLVEMCLILEWLFPSLSLVAATKLNGYRDMGEKIVVMVDRLQAGASENFGKLRS